MENSTIQSKDSALSTIVMKPEELRAHWQGHRKLTRRMIEAFPEHEFFKYSIGGMRPFSELVWEMIGMAAPGIQGVVTGEWLSVDEMLHHSNTEKPKSRKEYLELWDKVTVEIDTLWPQIPPSRFQEVDLAFGQWEGPMYGMILYWIDNEIHHRGQGYVYLRALGIEPPYFWERD